MEYRQSWEDLLFLHGTVSTEVLNRLLPAPLNVATFRGQAWVFLVLFRMRVRLRWLPFVPGVSRLIELNVRTNVHYQGRPGIWFLGLSADNGLAVPLSRLLTPLPYQWCPLQYELGPDGFALRCRAGSMPVTVFCPGVPTVETVAGSSDERLLERYRLFAHSRSKQLLES